MLVMLAWCSVSSVAMKLKNIQDPDDVMRFLYIINVPTFRSEGGFRQSEVVRNAELTLDLQGIGNVCDIGTLTLWCRQASIIFTQLVVSRSAFVSNENDIDYQLIIITIIHLHRKGVVKTLVLL